MTVVATAGHVDHGKSTLVEALTGVDPDRWTEEKTRGLTLDLGFGQVHLAAGPLSLIDVPGHDRYLSNMLAGVGAIDGCLFAVSAVEGWRAQSEEHLAILSLLGVTRAVVVLTMVDRANDKTIAAARLEIEGRLRRSPLVEVEVVEVSVPAGIGLEGLRLALDRMVTGIPKVADHERPRLWIDRSFSIRGIGTVVTGTLIGGILRTGEQIDVAPGDGTSRIRSIEVHGNRVEAARPGCRVAVNLAALAPDVLGRGQALVHRRSWAPTAHFDASLTVLASHLAPVTRRGSFLLHTGTGSWAVGLRVLGGAEVPPGTTGVMRVHLPEPLPLVPGDRYVLRDTGRGSTVGGGEVLDIAPVLPAHLAAPDRNVDRVVREHGAIDVDRLSVLTGERRFPTAGRWVISPEALSHFHAKVVQTVTASMPQGFDLASLDEIERALVDGSLISEVEVTAGLVKIIGVNDSLTGHPWIAALAGSPFRPPAAEGQTRSELRALVRHGLVVERAGIYFHPTAFDRAAELLDSLDRAHPEGFTASQARAILETSRKYALPLLEVLDARGTTIRRGDRRRLRRPRMPAPEDARSDADLDTRNSI